jgi:hypothetical protein
MERIVKGIDDLSLKDKDKMKLRGQLSSILSEPKGEAPSVGREG